MSDANALRLLQEEYRALKSEMLLRVVIQNICILLAVLLFVPCAILTILQPANGGEIALAYAAVNLALALQWCHQGVRQCAIKKAVLQRDDEAGRSNSWERWLPGQRPDNLLGSRWFISTKLVFMGLCLAVFVFARTDFGLALMCAAGLFAATALALLTNPKE